LLGRLKDAVFWAQALDRYSRQDFQAAIAKLNAIRGPRKRASEYLAILGSAYVALAKPEGRILLRNAITGSSPTRSEYQPYVRAYCEYYLAVLNGDQGMTVQCLERALRMDAPPIIRRWLPLS
jgi:hypothetical protein